MITIRHHLNRFPLTLVLVTTSLGLFLGPAPNEWFYFDIPSISDGQWYRMVLGHFMHADKSHLFWNMLGLIILSTLIEARSRQLLLIAVLIGVLAVSWLLVSPFSRLEIYCGLSGILNTLLVIALWNVWQDTHSRWVIATFIGSLAKIIIEINSQQSLISQVSWPPYPEAHLAGYIAGLISIACFELYSRLTI